MLRKGLVLCLLSFILPFVGYAAPFAEWFEGTSPKGVRVRVWGRGDEYSIRYEAEDGHAVVKDAVSRVYFYARQEADGALVSTGIAVGDETDADRAALAAIPLHQTDTSAAAREARRKRIARDDELTGRAARWAKLKETTRRIREAQEKGLLMAPPDRPSLGTVRGLTILIDFPVDGSDKTLWEIEHPSVTPEKLSLLLNADTCTFYGNSSSVRRFYLDASNGCLDYRNEVIGPILAPHPRAYYDDSSKDNGVCATNLIAHVFDVIKGDPDFETKYLPVLQSLSVEDGKVRSLNLWFAGPRSEEWGAGLWAHKWAIGSSSVANRLSFAVDGTTVKFYNYQITPVTSSPGIYTFCHENGHMLCGFPDMYVYYAWRGSTTPGFGEGSGYFTLMYGSLDKLNPPYFDAYLRAAAGWLDPQPLPSAGTVTVQNNHKDVWKYENPSNPLEYYLIENRQQTGRDASISGSGILIWRCNEEGDNAYPGDAELPGFDKDVHRANYELSLEQADGDYDLERKANEGDAYDTWYAGNRYSSGVFNDTSFPTAKWADATDSGLSLGDFSANGETMTFSVLASSGGAPRIPLAEALDNGELTFATGGGADWFGQAETSSDDVSAARSGSISHSKNTWLQTAVTGPGTISFQWRVSSESVKYDYLEFLVDGVQQDKIGGTTGNWSGKKVEIGEGVHVLCWNYHKDASKSSGEDAGYVDRVVWTPAEKVADPVISGPAGADFVPPAEVSISCATKGATIRYTLDGSEPTETSAVYVRPLVLAADAEIRARAYKAGLEPSAIVTAAYLKRRFPNDIFGTEGVVWTNDSDIPWREERGGTMRAGGLDGTTAYVSTLTATVKGRGTLKFAYKIVSSSYKNTATFEQDGKTLVETTDTGTFTDEVVCRVSSAAGATFTWTLTVKSPTYDYESKGIWLSDVVWEPDEKVETPVIGGPAATLFDGPVVVAVSCATAGATLRYTLDGSDPTEASAVVSGGTIRLTDDATVKVRAFKDGMSPSAIAAARYLRKAEPGVWTTDAERVRLSAAVDGRMICVAKLKETLPHWNDLGPILNDGQFLAWASVNGIYLVKWDSYADSSGTSESAVWYNVLYAQSRKTAKVNWEMCFARPDAPDTFCGYARAYGGFDVGRVAYDGTVTGMIAGFASILSDNGLTPIAPEIVPVISLLDWEKGTTEYDAAVAKITAIATGDNPAVDPQTLFACVGNWQLSASEIVFCNYIVASAKLGTSQPIYDYAQVDFTEVRGAASDGISFKFALRLWPLDDLEELTLVKEFVAGCIQTAGDLGTGFAAGQTVDAGRVTVDPETGKVTIAPDPAKTAEFFRIVIPRDPEP